MHNNPIKLTDPDGNDVILLNKSYGAGGNGHNGVLIGNDKNGWHYFSKDGPSGGKNHSTSAHNHQKYGSLNDFKRANTYSSERLNDYDRGYRVKTTVDQDSAMIKRGEEVVGRGYAFSEHIDGSGQVKQNCADMSADIISATDLDIDKPKSVNVVAGTVKAAKIFGPITVPNKQYEHFKANNQGEELKLETKPTKDSGLPPEG